MAKDIPLTFACGDYEIMRALKEGKVKPDGMELTILNDMDSTTRHWRILRNHEFDIGELSGSSYIMAKERGAPYEAIPVFPHRRFRHGFVFINTAAGIKSPEDLEGKRVGVNRGYTVTTGVWARGILAEEHGVDLSKITWVLSGDEHVAEYKAPKNVVPIGAGKNMQDMLISGELAGAIGVDVDHPDVKPLIPDALDAGLAALKSRGHYPINHVVVIRNDLLAKYPDLAADAFNAFAESRRLYVEKLKAGKIEKPTSVDKVHEKVMAITGDPLPFGVEPNRKVIEMLIGHAMSQGIITRKVTVDELFAPSTLKLKA